MEQLTRVREERGANGESEWEMGQEWVASVSNVCKKVKGGLYTREGERIDWGSEKWLTNSMAIKVAVSALNDQ